MKQDGTLRVGIIGAGRIAGTIAHTLNGMSQCEALAIGSRDLQKAHSFASQWNIPRAYGSYAEVIADPDIDMVYVATPHSHHYSVTRQALLAGKPCLVEKTFMANSREAKEIIDLAHERKVFLAEAIWTRYQPAVGIVRQLIADGRIGQPTLLTATLAYNMMHKERIFRADLGGGALLDVGVYALNFVSMFTDAEVKVIDGYCTKSESGMDLTDAITMVLEDGIIASIQAGAQSVGNNIGVIAGTKANIIVDNVNNPQVITVCTRGSIVEETIQVPQHIEGCGEPLTGYEYEFLACRQALIDGLLEPREMPHREILCIMLLMDQLRHKWGVHFPMD